MNNKHLKYLNYVLRHKWFVFYAGLKTGAPLWRLIIHDYSKFSRAEWSGYVESFYSGRPREETKDEFQRAWLHHLHNNPHHWLHWVLMHEDGTRTAFEMPHNLVLEMVADWLGAGRAITGHWDIAEWYEKNGPGMLLAPRTRKHADALVGDITSDIEDRLYWNNDD